MKFKFWSFILAFTLFFSFTYSKDRVVILPGTFQQVLGGNNWDPSGDVTEMATTDGNFYEFNTVLPGGNYEYKVAINESWEENYGVNGEQDGSNFKFTLKDSFTKMKFTFDYTTKKTAHTIIGKANAEDFKKSTPKAKPAIEIKENILLSTKEYIEKSATETLFLFKTPVGAKVDFFIGEKGKTLKKVVSAWENDGKGLTIGSLKEGVTYEYKIISNFLNKKLESKTENYTKETLIKTEERPDWAREAVFYQVFVRSFYDKDGDKVGDFQGLKEKIPYLKDLGVTALWLMPINSSPSYHGYDVTDYKNVNKNFGTIEDFKEFLDFAHKNGIKVVMDFVLNHVASSHPWFVEALMDKNSQYRDYFVWSTVLDDPKEKGSWGQQVWYNGGSEKFYAVFWSGMPDLNYRNPKVREEIKDATKFWLDLGLDGFRLDASRYIDTNNEVTKLWWHDFNSYVKSINKDAFIVGENWDNSIDFVGQFMENLDSSFNFSLRDTILSLAKGNDVNLMDEIELRDTIYSQYNEKFIDSIFIGNHDIVRVGSELKGNIKMQKLALSVLMTLKGTPFIYYGEEIGLLGTKPDENLREPMDWYKSAQGTGMTGMKVGKIQFTKANDGISVEEQEKDKNSILNYTKKLTKIRRENPVFINGKYTKLNSESKVNAYEITDGKESIIVVHNSNDKAINFSTKSGNVKVEAYSSAIVKNGKNLLD